MLRTSILMAIAATMLVGLGCSRVRSTAPMGTAPVALVPEEWDGTWHSPGTGGFISVKVRDAARGELEVASVGSEEHDKFVLQTLAVYVRQSGDWTFFSVAARDLAKDDEDEDNEGYVWGRIKKEGNRVVLWLPHFGRTASALAAGRLPGTKLSDSDILLGELREEHHQLIASQEKGVLLDWENPLVLIRMPQ